MTTRFLINLTRSLAIVAASAGIAAAQGDSDAIEFQLDLAKPAADAGCLPDAWAKVTVAQAGTNQALEVSLGGLPPNVEFKLFNIQVPRPPFGLSWYDGGVLTDDQGNAHEIFVGRFNADTFIVAPNVAPAPVIHAAGAVEGGTPDAPSNPRTDPIHTLHIGLWFPSQADATAVGCPAGPAPTPFNGKHNAGPLVFSSSSFPDAEGPLLHLAP